MRRVEIGQEDNEESKTSEGEKTKSGMKSKNQVQMVTKQCSQDSFMKNPVQQSVSFCSPSKQSSLHGQFNLKKTNTLNPTIMQEQAQLSGSQDTDSQQAANLLIMEGQNNQLAGTKRPRRAAALKQREDSSDPYIYNLGKPINRKRS